MANWEPTEIQLLEALRPFCTTEEIRQIFSSIGYNRSSEAISTKARKIGCRFDELGEPDLGWHSYAKQVLHHLRGTTPLLDIVEPLVTPSSKSSITIAAKKASYSAQELLSELITLVEVPARKHYTQALPPPSDGHSLVLQISDLHMGKKTEYLDGGIAFNIKIATQLLNEYPQRVLDHLPLPHKSFDEVVVLILGDMVDGEMVYRGQWSNIETHVAAQLFSTTQGLWQLLRDLAGLFPMVRVYTARGNHGRTEGSIESNWDNIIYQQLLLLSIEAALPNLTVHNKYGDFNTCMIQGWKGLLRHEAPLQSDTAAARNRIGGWRDIHQCDFIAYGHFHHIGLGMYNGMPLFRNGSFPGGDDYSERYGGWDGPTQLMFGITSNRLPSFLTPIYLQ